MPNGHDTGGANRNPNSLAIEVPRRATITGGHGRGTGSKGFVLTSNENDEDRHSIETIFKVFATCDVRLGSLGALSGGKRREVAKRVRSGK
jgi:hypothetical protein